MACVGEGLSVILIVYDEVVSMHLKDTAIVSEFPLTSGEQSLKVVLFYATRQWRGKWLSGCAQKKIVPARRYFWILFVPVEMVTTVF